MFQDDGALGLLQKKSCSCNSLKDRHSGNVDADVGHFLVSILTSAE